MFNRREPVRLYPRRESFFSKLLSERYAGERIVLEFIVFTIVLFVLAFLLFAPATIQWVI